MPNPNLALNIDARINGTDQLGKLEQALNRLAIAAEASAKKSDAASKQQGESLKNLASTTEQSLSKLSSSIQSGIADPLAAAKTKIESFVIGMGKVPAAGLGVVAGLTAVGVGLHDLAARYAASAEEAKNFATRLGVTVGEGQKFSAMAKIVGVDAGVLESSTRILAAALEDTTGAGSKATKALAALGISTKGITGDSRELGAVMTEVVQKLAGVEDITRRSALSNALLGRASKELAPLINDYQDLAKATEQLGIGLNQNATVELAALNRELKIADLAWDQFTKKLAVKIAEVEIPITWLFTGRFPMDDLPQIGDAYDRHTHQKSKSLAPGIIGVAPAVDTTKTIADLKQYTKPITGMISLSGVANGITPVFDPKYDITRGEKMAESYNAVLSRTDPEFIRQRIHEIEVGSVAKDGTPVKGTNELLGDLTSPSTAGLVKDKERPLYASAMAEKAVLEANLKTIEKQKSVQEEIAKLRLENAVKQKVGVAIGSTDENGNTIAGLPYGGAFGSQYLLPSDQKILGQIGNDATEKQVAELVAESAQQRQKEVTEALGRNGLKVDPTTGRMQYAPNEQIRATVESFPGGLGGPAKDAIELNKQLKERQSAAERDAIEEQARRDKDRQEALQIGTSTLTMSRQAQLERTQADIKIAGLGQAAGPDSEIQQASALAAAKKAAAKEVYDSDIALIEATYQYDENLADRKKERDVQYAKDVQEVQIELDTKRAELERQDREEARNQAGAFFDSIVSGKPQNFFRSQGMDIGKTVFQNATTSIFEKAKLPLTNDPTSTLGKLFKGTPFGADPLKGSVDSARTSLDLVRGSLDNLTAELKTAKSGSDTNGVAGIANASSFNSTGDLPDVLKLAGGVGDMSSLAPLTGASGLNVPALGLPDMTNLQQLQQVGGGDFSDMAAASPISSSTGGFAASLKALSTGGLTKGLSSVAADIKTFGNSGFAQGLGAGLGSGGFIKAFSPGYSGNVGDTPPDADTIAGTGPSTSERVGAGIAGAAAIAAGAMTAIHEFSRGGAAGALGGISAIAGTIAATIPVAAPIAAPIAAVTGLVSSLLGDNKARRQKEIANTLFNSQYVAPQALNVSSGTNGGYSDVGIGGAPRFSNLSPYPTVTTGYLDRPYKFDVPGTQTSQFGGGPAIQITQNFSALDAKSLMDRGADIANAAAHGMNTEYTQLHGAIRNAAGLG